MNAATLPPWLTPLGGGLLYGQRVYKPGAGGKQRARERLRPRLTIYTLGHDHSAPILSWSEDGDPRASSIEEGAAGSAVRWERVGMGAGGVGGPMRWERVPLDNSPWHLGLPVPGQPEISNRPPLLQRAEEGAAAAPWSGVLNAWTSGATLLAMLFLIVKFAGHYVFLWFLPPNRRPTQTPVQRRDVNRAEEWLMNPGDAEAGPGAELGPRSGGLPPPPRIGDRPPPYSAQTPAGAPKVEEPPPLYAEGDSCVRFIHKNGIPVLVFNRDPEERHRVQRIMRAAGINLATLGAPPPAAPPAPGLHQLPDNPDPTIDFNPNITRVISIVTDDDEVERCVIREASAPMNDVLEEGSSHEETSIDNVASAAETTTTNTNRDDDAKDGLWPLVEGVIDE